VCGETGHEILGTPLRPCVRACAESRDSGSLVEMDQAASDADLEGSFSVTSR
jgi:hypothetical protein